MKKLSVVVVLLLFVTGMAMAETVTGWVTDAGCAAKGRSGEAHKACAQKCLGKGAAAVLVSDDGKVLKVHNGDAVKDHHGAKVTATGKVEGDSIHIDSVKAAG